MISLHSKRLRPTATSRLFNGFETLNARVDLLAVSNEAMREDINRLVRLLTAKENGETSLTA